ncbi:MAG: purine nucleoside permease [Acidobacteriaceae bacterium]
MIPSFAQPAPIPVRVVIVTMWQSGNGTTAAPGEFHFWIQREHLTRVYPLPAGDAPVRMNARGVLGILTGVGTAKATASIMALGLDPRFDLTHAYWLIDGVAGGDPADTSLASAVWVRQVVNGSLAYEIDARQIPRDWSTGFVPLGKSFPYQQPAANNYDQVVSLNPGLTQWAFNLTRDTHLKDSPVLRAHRDHFPQAAARRAPFVSIGDEISSSTYWHGSRMDAWANRWVRYYTHGKGNFVVSAMEDSGTLQALAFLGHAGRVDPARVLVLRTVSNYDQQPIGLTPAQSLVAQRSGLIGCLVPALESDYAVGHIVVDTITNHWNRYRDRIPSAAATRAAAYQ